jgi:hypothetical protein
MSDTPIDMGLVSAPPAPAPSSPSPSQQSSAPQRVTPGSKEWADLPAEQRHAQLRGPENPRARGHSPARDHREEAAPRAAGEPAPGTGDQQNPPPAAGSADKVKIGRYEVSEAELGEMMTRQAADDLRKATLPAAPEAYEAKLPADLKLPGGGEYKFDTNDPSLVAARNWAHAKGLSQDEFSQVLGIYASHEAQRNAELAEISRAEIAKAGPNAPQRVDAIGKWIRAEVGDADARPILASLVTDAHLRFYEKMHQRISSQGSASFSQSHRVPPDDRGIPGYENMSFEQRRYAQDQQAARRR